MNDIVSNIDEGSAEDIKVCLRMRPLNKRECNPKLWKSAGEYAWKPMPEINSIVQVQRSGIPTGDQDLKAGRSIFTFDKIFDENDTTDYVYNFAGKELVRSTIEGRNASIFAYGQTGSGKTHTMQGNGTIRDGMLKDKLGIIHMVARDLFQEAELIEARDFVFNVSVIEVYNEEVKDLLSKAKDIRLNIREDTSRGVFVNATRIEANSLKKLLACLSAGERNRVVAKTTLNKRSSRSHIIFSINIESFSVNDISGTSGHSRVSSLNLVDLAGSESVRHRSAHSTDQRRKEAGSINKSLLTLSLVIQALGAPSMQTNNPRNHINYRDSKLTRVLQPSLSGNARLAFICCATASSLYMEETKSTLQFASRIKHIKTKSKINVMDDESISQVKEELHSVKQQMFEMNQKMKKMEFKNKQLRTQLEEMIEERDDAVERAVNFEKAKNVAVLAAVDAAAVAEKATGNSWPRGSRFGKPPIPSKVAGEMNGVSTANEKMSGQVGFLANVIDRLVAKKDDSVEYKKRQGTPMDMYESDSTIDGIRQNLRVDSSRTIMSDMTTPTRYGTHRSVSDGEDPVSLPILGLVEKLIEVHVNSKNAVARNDEDPPSATETTESGVEGKESRYDMHAYGIPVEEISP